MDVNPSSPLHHTQHNAPLTPALRPATNPADEIAFAPASNGHDQGQRTEPADVEAEQRNLVAQRARAMRHMARQSGKDPDHRAVGRKDFMHDDMIKQNWNDHYNAAMKDFKFRATNVDRHFIALPGTGVIMGFIGGMAIGMVLAYVEGRRLTEEAAAGKAVGKPIFATDPSVVVAGIVGAVAAILGHIGYSLYTTSDFAENKRRLVAARERVANGLDNWEAESSAYNMPELVGHFIGFSSVPSPRPESVNRGIEAWLGDERDLEAGRIEDFAAPRHTGRYTNPAASDLQIPVGDGFMAMDLQHISANLRKFAREFPDRQALDQNGESSQAAIEGSADGTQAAGQTFMNISDHLNNFSWPAEEKAQDPSRDNPG